MEWAAGEEWAVAVFEAEEAVGFEAEGSADFEAEDFAADSLAEVGLITGSPETASSSETAFSATALSLERRSTLAITMAFTIRSSGIIRPTHMLPADMDIRIPVRA